MSTTATYSPGTSLPDLLWKLSYPPHEDITLRSSDSRVQKFYVVDSSPVLREKILAAMCHGVLRLEGELYSTSRLAKEK